MAEEREDRAGAGIVQVTRGSVAPWTDKVFGYRFKIMPHYDVAVPNKAPKRAQSRGNATTTSSTVCTIGPIGFKEKASCQLVDVLCDTLPHQG
jgi:hypothetical protein